MMKKRSFTGHSVDQLVDQLMDTYEGDSGINFIDAANLPVRSRILVIIDELFEILFPGHTGNRVVAKASIRFVVGDVLCQVYADLTEQVAGQKTKRYPAQNESNDDIQIKTHTILRTANQLM